MTNYTKSTNFTSKDSLPSGNALKIVRGSELDTEFNSIATAVNTKADLLSPTFTGTPLAPTAASGTNTTQVATTAFVTAVENTIVALKAPLASPALTGTPTSTTAAIDTSTTQIATTAFVIAQAASATPLANGVAAVGTSTRFARQDHVHIEGGIGVGQTWQNVLSSRVSGTTYTNSTGKPIMVSVSSSTTGGGLTTITIVIGGVSLGSIGAYNASTAESSGRDIFIVPTGSTYSVSSNGTIVNWTELR